MKITYKPTFEQFSDNYLATHYSAGVRTMQRLGGGPLIMLAGSLIVVFANDRVALALLRWPLILLGVAVFIYGLSYALGPLFNVFLVWLRRGQIFSAKAVNSLELKGNDLYIEQNGESVKMPVKQIQSVQHRADSSWLLTYSDNLIFIPREGLLSGDHDKFVHALEEKIAPDEE
jgi:hypothetical protein